MALSVIFLLAIAQLARVSLWLLFVDSWRLVRQCLPRDPPLDWRPFPRGSSWSLRGSLLGLAPWWPSYKVRASARHRPFRHLSERTKVQVLNYPAKGRRWPCFPSEARIFGKPHQPYMNATDRFPHSTRRAYFHNTGVSNI